MPSEHGASCFCCVFTSATERIESDEALVGKFDHLVMNSLHLIDQRAITIVMIFRSGDGYAWGRAVFMFSVGVRDFSVVRLTYRVKLVIVDHIRL